MLKRTAALLALTLCSLLSVRAQETITINLATNNGAASYRASGFLHGINLTTPADSLVTPMKSKLFRFDDNVAGNSGGGQYGINSAFYSRVVGFGAQPMYILLHAWIDNVGGFNPTNARVIHAGDIANWQTMVATSVNDAISRGQTVQWDIFNEPDITDFWTGTQAEAFAAWKAAVQTIRGIDSGQKIVGPSTCCSNSTGGGWIVDLLSYAQTNSVLPNILDFHEASFGPAQLASDVAAWKTYLAANYPGITLIAVSEYGQNTNYLLPGTVVQYMAAADRSQLYEAAHTCWNGSVCETSTATLAEALQLSQATNAIWYADQGYANITGYINAVTPSATVDGISGCNSSTPEVDFVGGRSGATSTVTFNFASISSCSLSLIVGGKVHITLSDLANDNGTGSSGPVVISSADVSLVSGNASVAYALPTNDAVLIKLTPATGGGGATYYVDWGSGSDTNNGTAKGTPWQHAPGMNGCASNCNITPSVSDQIILKGGVTWPNAAFTWEPPNGIYTVDQTWFAGGSWSRPIMDLGNAAPTDSLYRIVLLCNSNVTLDNYEWTDIAALPSAGNGQTNLFDWCGGAPNDHVTEMYVHGWHNPYFSVGTGNYSNGSFTVTNFVPFSYSPSPSAGWGSCGTNCQVQLGGVPESVAGNSCPTVSAVSGSNPYTITFTCGAGPAVGNCTGCLIMLGADFLRINGGGETAETNDSFESNVVDGSDTTEVQYNPTSDCGLTEANNQYCIASGWTGWREPNIFRNNVLRFIANAMVGGCTEWSGNLVENVRLSTDPTAHTNAVECLDDFPISNTTLFYNNVIRHTTNPNASTPSGRWSIGLGAIQPSPIAGETAYIFNNVFYDILQNAVFERGTTTGTQKVFNNSANCGPSWDLSFTCMNPIGASDIIQNNYFVTTNGNPIGSCSGCTKTTNLVQSPTTATSLGYTPVQTYAYSPTSAGSPTVGAGTAINTLTFCNGLGLINATAGTACGHDTTYAVGYNSSNHTVIPPGRPVALRSNPPDIGGYQFVTGGLPAATLSATSFNFLDQGVSSPSSAVQFTVTNTGGANLIFVSEVLSNGLQYATSGNTCLTNSIAPAGSCNISVTFTPAAVGPQIDTLTFTNNATPPTQAISLTGNGVRSVGPPPVAIMALLSVSTRRNYGNLSNSHKGHWYTGLFRPVPVPGDPLSIALAR